MLGWARGIFHCPALRQVLFALPSAFAGEKWLLLPVLQAEQGPFPSSSFMQDQAGLCC